MRNSWVLFRVDGSTQLGVGHIMRCVALAQELEKIGIKSVFICRNYSKKTTSLINNYGYQVKLLPKDETVGRQVDLTLTTATYFGARLVIVDLSQRETRARWKDYKQYLQALKQAGKIVLMIDGFGKEAMSAQTRFPVDIVVAPYWGAEKIIYKLSKKSLLLAGAKYFIFRQEFVRLAKKPKKITQGARDILVILGGGNMFELMKKVAVALTKIQKEKLNLTFLQGFGGKRIELKKVDLILQNFKGKYALLETTKSISRLMVKSDVAIISNGTIKYELAVTGTPGVAFAVNSFKKSLLDDFQSAGSLMHLGLAKNVPEKSITTAVEKLLANRVLRQQMANKGQCLVDGYGGKRVAGKIKEYLEKIR